MKYLRAKNWEKFQQYKDRAPKWIKVYGWLLDDYDFQKLPDAARFHLIGIWMLASKMDNKIPYDADFVKNRIGASGKIDLDAIVESGFLQVVDTIECTEPYKNVQNCTDLYTETDYHVQNCTQRREEERRVEKRREEEKKAADAGTSISSSNFSAAWNAMAKPAGITEIKNMTQARRASLRTRSNDQAWRSNWKDALELIQDSPFLRGENERGWRANPDWFLKPDSVTKIMEGKYDDGRPHIGTVKHDPKDPFSTEGRET